MAARTSFGWGHEPSFSTALCFHARQQTIAHRY